MHDKYFEFHRNELKSISMGNKFFKMNQLGLGKKDPTAHGGERKFLTNTVLIDFAEQNQLKRCSLKLYFAVPAGVAKQ